VERGVPGRKVSEAGSTIVTAIKVGFSHTGQEKITTDRSDSVTSNTDGRSTS
jgi:hypothetical protein